MGIISFPAEKLQGAQDSRKRMDVKGNERDRHGSCGISWDENYLSMQTSRSWNLFNWDALVLSFASLLAPHLPVSDLFVLPPFGPKGSERGSLFFPPGIPQVNRR